MSERVIVFKLLSQDTDWLIFPQFMLSTLINLWMRNRFQNSVFQILRAVPEGE